MQALSRILVPELNTRHPRLHRTTEATADSAATCRWESRRPRHQPMAGASRRRRHEVAHRSTCFGGRCVNRCKNVDVGRDHRMSDRAESHRSRGHGRSPFVTTLPPPRRRHGSGPEDRAIRNSRLLSFRSSSLWAAFGAPADFMEAGIDDVGSARFTAGTHEQQNRRSRSTAHRLTNERNLSWVSKSCRTGSAATTADGWQPM